MKNASVDTSVGATHASPSLPTARVYLCECGPIIKDAIDLDGLAERLAKLPEVGEVLKYSTLCSEDGKAWMMKDLAEHTDTPVVVAGCSPREHGTTFMDVCRVAGVNPYLLAMANIREQCTWVTPDKEQAGEKALAIIRSAVARALRQEPLDDQFIDANNDVLVIGAGVAGLTAAQMLAEGDRNVYLVERAPAIGGRTPLLGDVYPNLECASCMIESLMDEVLHHPRIEVLTYSEVEEVLGYFGNFTARIRKWARHVNPDDCYGCRTCHAACQVDVLSEFDNGLSKRKAIYIPYEGALPSATLIDESKCLHFQGQECDACVGACPFGSIDLSMKDEIVVKEIGAVILATGAEPKALEIPDEDAHVISSMTLERLLNSAGPTSGELCLPGLDSPRSIALIHCADEAGFAPTFSCSKICCMSFAKYIHQIHEKLPECAIHQFMWERCVGGKGFKEFANAIELTPGLAHIGLRPTDHIDSLAQEDKQVSIDYTLNGKPENLKVDLVVVSPILTGAKGIEKLASLLRVEIDNVGFVIEEHERLKPFKTRMEGVLVAGSARGPGDIQDAAAQGAAAAGNVLASLVPGRKLFIEPTTAEVDGEQCGACHTCVVTCPYNAVTFNSDTNTAEVNKLLCRGCGSCAAACPTGAAVHRHFTDEQLVAEIDAYLK
ncbi:MAG: CoB--CoM heterodisulfide reductase iron-sulfur subunit A family protein [Deltaproteobacteria bacterium]|nr:CoB--CoM heterodisulfide reductase iron-sulfur subunit A family protein [Deltaproteobacteria bacterium]